MNSIKTNHGDILLPAFMPDATYGAIKAVSFDDAKKAGVNEIVTTTLHIEQKLGSQFVKSRGGLHNFFKWDRPILTDSGGWQVFSLINSKKSKTKNMITDLGCSFFDENTGKQSLLTPESSITIQSNMGSDIFTVLDDPILGDASFGERKKCVEINTDWAKRGIKKFNELYARSSKTRPLIGCVIQGGNDLELRKQSAEELLELDYDLYNFGGMPLRTDETWKTENKKGFYHEMLEYVSNLIPDTKIKYAMGVGQPDDIAFCVDAGWNLFDTVLPTRNARHGYLYVSEGEGDASKSYKTKKGITLAFDLLHLRTERYLNDDSPVDSKCDCECCKTVSRSYLRHLIRIKEASGFRLATIHNLQFYSKWMEMLRTK
jgi:queuine tRNA-ribosyltransferase